VTAALAISIAVSIAFGFSDMFVFNPPYLLFLLNMTFWSAATIAVTYFSAKSFLKDDSITILLLNVSMILLGLSIIISGWVSNFSGDYSVAISNCCALVASILQVLSGVFIYFGKQKTEIPQRRGLLLSVYISTVVFVAAVSSIVLLGFMPRFFIASGPTQLEQVVLGLTVFFFALASVIFGGHYIKSRAPTLFWYTLAIGLFSLGFYSAFEVMKIGDVTSWLGRITLYVADIFLIASLLEARKSSEDGSNLANGWSHAFIANREQSAKLFENMLNGFMYCKIITDSSGKPVDWIFLDINKSFEKIMGLKREEVIGKKASGILLPSQERNAEFADSIKKYGQIALTGNSERFELRRESMGKWLYVLAYSPKKGYFVTLFDDISERKKAEEELENQRKNLELLVEERTKQLKDAERLATIGATAGMVGHDIRNPLQAIVSDTYLLKEELTPTPEGNTKKAVMESLDSIDKNIDYINKIVQDLQDYARPIKPTTKKLGLEQIFQEVTIEKAIPSSIQVFCKIDDAAKEIVSDDALLKRVLANLVNNAVQAMPQGGELRISAYREANDVLVAVQDTGGGIPEEFKAKLFTPLFTTKSKGQGFGLAVVKRLTEALGGTVTFESQEGVGTTFIVRLPQSQLRN